MHVYLKKKNLYLNNNIREFFFRTLSSILWFLQYLGVLMTTMSSLLILKNGELHVRRKNKTFQ